MSQNNEMADIYHEFINSEEWRAVRNAFVEGKSCTMCGSAREIQAHHLKYEQGIKGYCNMDNLVPLCRTCHEKVHMLEFEIKEKWWRFEYVRPFDITFRMLALKHSYEHGGFHGIVSTNDYLIRMVQCLTSNIKNLTINVEDSHGNVISEKYGKKVFETRVIDQLLETLKYINRKQTDENNIEW